MSRALPLPLGSGARGGGAEGIFKTDANMSSSLSNLPLWINRSRCWDVGGSSFDRIRRLKVTTVVSFGSGISRRRSGIEVVKRTVMCRRFEDIVASYDALKEDIVKNYLLGLAGSST